MPLFTYVHALITSKYKFLRYQTLEVISSESALLYENVILLFYRNANIIIK